MPTEKKGTGHLVTLAWVLIYLCVFLFAWYLIVLISNGYINPNYNFDFGIAKDIGAFVGNFIAPFLTFAGTLLLIANFREVKKTNKDNNDKVLTDKTMELFKWYLTDLQKERKRLSMDFDVPQGTRTNLHQYVPILPTNTQMKKYIDDWDPILIPFFEHAAFDERAPNVIGYLLMLDYFAACVLEEHVNQKMISEMLSTQFVKESRLMVLYIIYYQKDDSTFCERVIQLYLDWKGKYGTNGQSF